MRPSPARRMCHFYTFHCTSTSRARKYYINLQIVKCQQPVLGQYRKGNHRTLMEDNKGGLTSTNQHVSSTEDRKGNLRSMQTLWGPIFNHYGGVGSSNDTCVAQAAAGFPSRDSWEGVEAAYMAYMFCQQCFSPPWTVRIGRLLRFPRSDSGGVLEAFSIPATPQHSPSIHTTIHLAPAIIQCPGRPALLRRYQTCQLVTDKRHGRAATGGCCASEPSLWEHGFACPMSVPVHDLSKSQMSLLDPGSQPSYVTETTSSQKQERVISN
jgi:hypothetical protein